MNLSNLSHISGSINQLSSSKTSVLKRMNTQQTPKHLVVSFQDASQRNTTSALSTQKSQLLSVLTQKEDDLCAVQLQGEETTIKIKMKSCTPVISNPLSTGDGTSAIGAQEGQGALDLFGASVFPENHKAVVMRKRVHPSLQEVSSYQQRTVLTHPISDKESGIFLVEAILKNSDWIPLVKSRLSESRNLFNEKVFDEIKMHICSAKSFTELVQNVLLNHCESLNNIDGLKPNESIEDLLEYLYYWADFLEVLMNEVLENATDEKITLELKFVFMQARRLVGFFRFLNHCPIDLFSIKFFVEQISLMWRTDTSVRKEDYAGGFTKLDFLLHQQEYAETEYISRIFQGCCGLGVLLIVGKGDISLQIGQLTDVQKILTGLSPLLLSVPQTKKIRRTCEETSRILDSIKDSFSGRSSKSAEKSRSKKAYKIKKLWEKDFTEQLWLAKAKELKQIFIRNISRCFDLFYDLSVNLKKIETVLQDEYLNIQLSEAQVLKDSLTELGKNFQWVPDIVILDGESLFMHKKSFLEKLKKICWLILDKIACLFHKRQHKDAFSVGSILIKDCYTRCIGYLYSQVTGIMSSVIQLQDPKQSYTYMKRDQVLYTRTYAYSSIPEGYLSLSLLYQNSSTTEEAPVVYENANRASYKFPKMFPGKQERKFSVYSSLSCASILDNNNKELNKIFLKIREMDFKEVKSFLADNFVEAKKDIWLKVDAKDQRTLLEKIYDTNPNLFAKKILPSMGEVFKRNDDLTHLLWRILLNKGALELLALIFAGTQGYTVINSTEAIAENLLGQILERGLWPLAHQFVALSLWLFPPTGSTIYRNFFDAVIKHGESLLDRPDLDRPDLDRKDLADYKTHLKVFLFRLKHSMNIPSQDDKKNRVQDIVKAIQENNIEEIKCFFKEGFSLCDILTVRPSFVDSLNKSPNVLDILKIFYEYNPSLGVYFRYGSRYLTLIQYFVMQGNLKALEYLYFLPVYSQSHKNSLSEFLKDEEGIEYSLKNSFIQKEKEEQRNLKAVKSFLYKQVEKNFFLMKSNLPKSFKECRQKCLSA